jgi:Ca2+-binding RTX toxin-like protein
VETLTSLGAWKAGGNSNTFNIDDVGYDTASAAGLTAGTITPTGASVNTKSGFSIITYTASGTAGATVEHGLEKEPSFIIVKNRDYAQNWFAYHNYIGGVGGFNFNTSQAAFTSDSGYWNNTNPSSTLITLGNYHGAFGTHSYVAYAWAEIPGFSKFGSYTGNGKRRWSVCLYRV